MNTLLSAELGKVYAAKGEEMGTHPSHAVPIKTVGPLTSNAPKANRLRDYL